jgi:hypothetical protein
LVTPPRKARHDFVTFTPDQARRFLEAVKGDRLEALYVLALHTGLRQGELLGLTWTDVDLEGGRLSVRRSLKVTGHGLDFGPLKNKASRRSVRLSTVPPSYACERRPRKGPARPSPALDSGRVCDRGARAGSRGRHAENHSGNQGTGLARAMMRLERAGRLQRSSLSRRRFRSRIPSCSQPLERCGRPRSVSSCRASRRFPTTRRSCSRASRTTETLIAIQNSSSGKWLRARRRPPQGDLRRGDLHHGDLRTIADRHFGTDA